LTRAELDGRTNAAKLFDHIVGSITKDLGGDVSTVTEHLICAFAGAALVLEDANVRLLTGREFDPGALCQAVTAMVRVGQRLGLTRVPKDVTSASLNEIARDLAERDLEDGVT
jgi:hypothetical protein